MPQPSSRTMRLARAAIVVVLATSALTVCAAIAAADDDEPLSPSAACAAPPGPDLPDSALDSEEVADMVKANAARNPRTDTCPGRVQAGSSVIPDVVGMGLGVVLPAFRLAPQTMARFIVPPHQFSSFDSVITRESGWNVFAVNPTSGAYGLGQALPAHKMSTAGPDWCCNPVTQIRWTYDYMNQRYGGPDGAWAFWQSHGWY